MREIEGGMFVPQAASRLGLSEAVLRGMIRSQKIQVIVHPNGRYKVIPLKEVERLDKELKEFREKLEEF